TGGRTASSPAPATASCAACTVRCSRSTPACAWRVPARVSPCGTWKCGWKTAVCRYCSRSELFGAVDVVDGTGPGVHGQFAGIDAEILALDVERAHPVFGWFDHHQRHFRPDVEVDLLQRAVEVLDLDRAVSLVERNNLEQRTGDVAIPCADGGWNRIEIIHSGCLSGRRSNMRVSRQHDSWKSYTLL